MSWRQESTFKKSSALTEDEKEYLKVAKKIREILKLEEKTGQGEKLEAKQLEKVGTKAALLKEIVALIPKLPSTTELFDKNPDITELLPSNMLKSAERNREDAEVKRREEEERRKRREQRDREERDKPIYMSRHDRPIMNVAATTDGRYLFTCSKDKAVICWDMKERFLEALCTLGGHVGAVFALDLCPASAGAPSRLASGGADGKVMLWPTNMAQRRAGSVVSPEATIEHGGIVRAVRWCPFDEGAGPRRLATGCEKLASTPSMIAVWRVPGNGKAEQILKITDNLPGKANDIRWAGGSKMKLISAHDNGYVGIWLAEAPGSLLKTLNLHKKPVTALCVTPDGNAFVTASRDSSAMVVDISKPSCDIVATYKAGRQLNAVAVSEDFKAGEDGAGLIALAGGQDDREVTTQKAPEGDFDVMVFDAVSGENVAAGKGHFGPVHQLLLVPGEDPSFASVAETACLKVHAANGRLVHSDMRE